MSASQTTYDYVVVGAGAAGCVVANRLSEDGSSVLVLEAGGKDSNPLIHIPVGFTKLTTPDVNWGFETVPQPQMNNREMWYPQGRTLGGSTSINAMIYIRGNRLDYETWKAQGNEGWGYDEVLPYFRKSEHNERFSNQYHGFGGDMSVSTQIECNPLSKAWVRALQELGTPYNPDVNGADQYGVTYYDVTQRNARRESSSTAFLRPVKDRPNLHIVTRAQASRIVIENGRAVGLEYTTKKGLVRVNVNREVILSGGAVNSPKLLMLSGIGDSDELKLAGVTPVHHLPGVGKNFQDHMDVYLTAETVPLSYNMEDRWDRAARHLIQYGLYRKGPMTAAVCEAGAFVYSSEFGGPEAPSPDIQMHILPAYVIDHGRQRRRGHGITINTCNLRPRSIGSVKLRSADPSAHPLIDPNFCGDAEGYDWRVSMAGFRWGRALLQSEALKPFIKYEFMPGNNVQTDEELKAYIRQWSKTDYHPVGSCKMGSDDMAVVDEQLRVHGIQGLRVVDASIMPTLISGNTQAPSIMIGEKGAAIILAGALV
jgi:choline dehydrogenase-like flavoprotein